MMVRYSYHASHTLFEFPSKLSFPPQIEEKNDASKYLRGIQLTETYCDDKDPPCNPNLPSDVDTLVCLNKYPDSGYTSGYCQDGQLICCT